MAIRSNWRDDSTSFDVDVEDLDLDATTPIRSFDVRAAFDFDQTVANPDHPLITAEREIWNRERSHSSSPHPVLAPTPSLYAVAPPARLVAPPSPPPMPRYSAPSVPPTAHASGTYPESHGSLAPTAMELPQSYFPSFATPASGVKAPPLSIVSSTAIISQHAAAPLYLDAQAPRRVMSAAKIAAMCGALAVAAAVVAFTAASGADSATGPSAAAGINGGMHNASAPQQETTAIPTAARTQTAPAQVTALPADVAQLLVAPADPNADWRARLMQNQTAATGGPERR